MTSKQPTSTGPSHTGMRSEIQTRWYRLRSNEISALKDKDDLVAKVQTKYHLSRAQAQRDVDAFAKGRQL